MATIISIASGKGGVGKSVVAANLAVLLARRGKQVVLADLDVGGADAHILFGMLHPTRTLTDFLNKQADTLEAVAQPVPGHARLRLIPGTGETLATANMPYGTKKRLIGHFKDVVADIIVVDIGAGTSYHALDFFLMGDRQLAVATPDPTSVLDLYRFIKLAAIRRVLSAFLSRDAITQALSERDFSSIEEVLEVAGQTNEAGRATAEATLHHFQPCLILNRVSGRSRVNVLQLKKLLKHYVGGDLAMLGEIPDDQAMERSVRAYHPVVEADPDSPAARALGRITDALLAHIDSSTGNEF